MVHYCVGANRRSNLTDARCRAAAYSRTQIAGTSKKNESLDLQSVLDLNAITLSDPDGDEVVIKLLVKQSEAELSLFESSETTFLKSEAVRDGVLFSIDVKELNKTTGARPEAWKDYNSAFQPISLNVYPSTSPENKAGIPLQIWSETRVQGDVQEKFNVAG